MYSKYGTIYLNIQKHSEYVRYRDDLTMISHIFCGLKFCNFYSGENIMNPRKKMMKKSILSCLLAGLGAGAGILPIHASTPAIAVSDPNQTISSPIHYEGHKEGTLYPGQGIIYVPEKASGGTITIAPSDGEMTGDFDIPYDHWAIRKIKYYGEITSSNITSRPEIRNVIGIETDSQYRGKIEIKEGTKIALTAKGIGIIGTVIYNPMWSSGYDNGEISPVIHLPKNASLSFVRTGTKTMNTQIWGLFNGAGKMNADENLSIAMKAELSFPPTESIYRPYDTSDTEVAAVVNMHGAVSLGDGYHLSSEVTAPEGKIDGYISGIESGKQYNSPFDMNGASLTLGKGGKIDVSLTNNRDYPTLYRNNLKISSFYARDTNIYIKDDNTYTSWLGKNIKASSVDGTGIYDSDRRYSPHEVTIGNNFTQKIILEEGTMTGSIDGVRIKSENKTKAMKVNIGDHFTVSINNLGSTTTSTAFHASSSDIHIGDNANIINHQYSTKWSDFYAEFSKSYEWKVCGLKNSGATIALGKDSAINVAWHNQTNRSDIYSRVIGISLFKNIIIIDTAAFKRKGLLSIGENGETTVSGSNVPYIIGIETPHDGFIELGKNHTLSVNASESNNNVLGYLMCGGHIYADDEFTLAVNGVTDLTDAKMYGIYNGLGTFEGRNTFSMEAKGKGYAYLAGIYNGRWNLPNYVLYWNDNDPNAAESKVTMGDHFHMVVENDGLAYGIHNDTNKINDGDKEISAHTSIGKNADLSVKGDEAYGIYSSGKDNETLLDDGASLAVEGKTKSSGVYSGGGALVKFAGSVNLLFTGGGDRKAVVSEGEGSLSEMTGNGRKIISGNLSSKDEGKISIAMDTGDSSLTGKSSVKKGNTQITLKNGARWKGDSSVEGGTMNLSMYRGAVWEGASLVHEGSASVSMDKGSLWKITGESHVTRLSLNGSAMADMAYNKDDHILTIDHFIGKDGVLNMKSDLESQTGGDRVHIGESDEGSSGFISVYDRSLATGSKVVGNRLLLLVTDDSGKSSFEGKDLDTGGLWDVTPSIQQGGTFTDENGTPVGNGNEWYLVKIQKKISKDADTLARNMKGNYGFYRQSIDTLRQRLGDLRYDGQREDRNDIWARNSHGEFEADGYSGKYNFLQVGMDREANRKSYYGFLVERGISNPYYHMGSGKNHSLSYALYATWLGDRGSYTDIVAKVGRNDGHIRTFSENEEGSWRENVRSLSFEYGRNLSLGKGYFIEPEVQLTLGHLSDNSYTTSHGTRVHQESFHSAIGRVGMVIGRKAMNRKHPFDFYAKISLLHEFGGNRSYTLDRTNNYGDAETFSGSDSYKDSWLEAGIGGNLQINDRTFLYMDAEKSFGSYFSKKWQYNLGIRWTF